MPRALPSDVVRAIEVQFPWTVGDWRKNINQRNGMAHYAANVMPGLLRLINNIPEELLVFDAETNARFQLALAALEASATRASTKGAALDWLQLVKPGTTEQDDCLMIVKDALASCPDSAPSTSTKDLSFISDRGLRQNLLVDLGSAERARNGGEWKTVTVLAGSIIEALLLWAISRRENESKKKSAYESARESRNLTKDLPLDDLTARAWDLHSYLEIARALEEITESTANDCRRAKFYRNLVHPAASEREKVENTRGNAHVALGAAYNVIDELNSKYSGKINENDRNH